MLSLDLWSSRDLNPPGSTNAPRYITRTRSIQSTWCSTNVSMAPDLQSLRRKICLSSWSCLCTGRMWVRTHAYRRLVWNCAYQLLLPESTWIYDWKIWKLVKDRTIVSVRVPNRLIEAKFKSFSWASLCSTAVLCQEFHDHWLVRPKISNLIYRMALHTSENSCPKASRRCSWGELNAIGCVWCRRPWDTANIDFFIGSILRVIILRFRQTDTFSLFFNMQHSCQRFNARRESKIPYSGANTSTGRKSSRDSWKSARWTGALRPTLLGYFFHFCSSMNLSLLSFFWVLFLVWLCCVLLLYSATWYMYDIIVVYWCLLCVYCYYLLFYCYVWY